MKDEKPHKMKVEPGAEPGIELDAKGNPIPVEKRTGDHRAAAVAAESVRRKARDDR